MKNSKLRKLWNDPVFSSNFTLLVLLNIGNIFSYLFQILMAKQLGPADYGVLAVLTGITYIFSIPTFSIQTIIAKQVTKFNVKGETSKIKSYLISSLKKIIPLTFIIFFIYLIISIPLSSKLNISFALLAITGIFLFWSFFGSIGTGVLQGMKKFRGFGLNNVVNSSIKLLLGYIFVWLGFKVYGAIAAVVLGVFVAFLLVFPFIKEVLRANNGKIENKLFSKDNILIILALMPVVIIYSSDVALARMIFPAEIVGIYAVASIIGKIILFGTLSLGSAMFPLSAEKFINGEKTHSIIRKTFLIMAVLCAIPVLLYALAPKFIITILQFGSQYLAAAPLLVYLGSAFTFISFLNVLILYRISINEFKWHHLLILFIFLISIWVVLPQFSESIEQFSIAFAILASMAFIGSVVLIRKWKS